MKLTALKIGSCILLSALALALTATCAEAKGKHPAYVAALKKQREFLKKWPPQRRWKEYYTYQKLSWQLGREVMATQHLKPGQVYQGHKMFDFKKGHSVGAKRRLVRPVQVTKAPRQNYYRVETQKPTVTGHAFQSFAQNHSPKSYQDTQSTTTFAAVATAHSTN